MADTLEIRFAGSGGQGVILCSILLATAALENDVYVAQSQSYGPEARGGSSKAEVVISNEPIDFPKVEQSDVLLALTQDSLERYVKSIKPGSVVIYDSSLDMPEGTGAGKVISAPILETASEKIGKSMVANIVALGAINNFLKIADEETLRKVVLANVPKGTEELNMKALEEGMKLL